MKRTALHRALFDMENDLKIYSISVDLESRIISDGFSRQAVPFWTSRKECKKIFRKFIIYSKFRKQEEFDRKQNKLL